MLCRFSLFFSLVLLSLSSAITLAQNRDRYWPSESYELNFSSGSAVVTQSFASHLNRGMGVMSDNSTGALLMYTDGYTVFNKNHVPMPNGSNLIPSTTSNSIQESIIIPKPGSSTIYYIFTTDPWNGQSTSGLYYSEVDMSLQGGLGNVTATKRVWLLERTTNALTAVIHANNRDFWLVTHEYNTSRYYIVSVTDQGVSSTIAQQLIGATMQSFGGQTKFSTDGKKLAVNSSSGVDLMNFDAATGTLSNRIVIPSPGDGLEFSSDGAKVYSSDGESIYQIDVSLPTSDEIIKSRYRIKGSILNNDLKQFQLAPDGKIYITKGGGGGGTLHLGVIDNPNALGPDVVLRENGLYLNGASSFVNMTPNFIQSDLFKTSFVKTGHCQAGQVAFRVTSEFMLDSVRWDFGEGSVSRVRNPKIRYNNAGTYTVKLYAFYGLVPQTISIDVKIDPYTSFDLGSDIAVCQGTLFAAPTSFPKYLWNNGDTTRTIHVTAGGRLKLTNTNQFGCSFSDSLVATVYDVPVIQLPDTVSLGSQSSIELRPGTFTSYEWNTGQTTPTIVVSRSAWYSVQVRNAAGCTSAKSVFVRNSSTTTPSVAKWKLINPQPSLSAGADMHFIDDQTGFIVNGKELLRTTDGGDTWKIQMTLNGGARIGFKNSIGYIVCTSGSVYKSTHRGGGWNAVNAPQNVSLNAVTVIHPDTVIATGDSKVFITKDGGQSWLSYAVGAAVKHSFFTSSKVGHAVCSSGTIRKTTDGGVTWRTTLSSNIIPSSFFKVFFVNKDVGYATREFSDVFKTTNGGETWTNIAGSSLEAGYDLQFLSESFGFVAGELGFVSKTIDGGATWQWAGFGGLIYGNDFNAIYFVDENKGFATGLGGRIIRTFDGGKNWKEYATMSKNIRQVTFESQQVGYILSGTDIFKTLDQGVSFTKVTAPVVGAGVGRFAMVNELIGYAIVGGRAVYKTTDGGISWSKPHAAATIADDDLGSIYFINPQVGFVSGGYNYRTVLRTTDGGVTWAFVQNAAFGKIQFINENLGFAYTANGIHSDIYKTTNGGATWSIVFGLDNNFNSLHFINETTGYVVGDGAIVYKTTNGGANWQKITSMPYADYVDVKAIKENVFALDDYGTVQFSSNGGSSWSTDLFSYGLSRLDVFDDNVYASGDHGAILTRSLAVIPVTPPPTLPVTGLESGSNFSIYPNPAHKEVMIGAAASDITFKYEIVDMLGRTVLTGSSDGKSAINLTNITPGLYLVKTTDSTSQRTVRLLIE